MTISCKSNTSESNGKRRRRSTSVIYLCSSDAEDHLIIDLPSNDAEDHSIASFNGNIPTLPMKGNAGRPQRSKKANNEEQLHQSLMTSRKAMLDKMMKSNETFQGTNHNDENDGDALRSASIEYLHRMRVAAPKRLREIVFAESTL
jgi:hypothetical protein